MPKYLITIMLLLIPSISRADIASGLVGYWNLNDNSGTSAADKSGRGNTGTLTNGPAWVLGKNAGAVLFDGTNDYIAVANESNFDFERTQPFSIAAWLFRSSNSTEDEIFVKYGTGYQGYGLYIFTDDTIRFSVANTISVNEASARTASGLIPEDSWNHVVATYDGSSSPSGMAIYVNGVSQSLTTGQNSLTLTTLHNNAPWIADDSTSPGCCGFDGAMDDIRVYSRALSAGDVTELYSFGAPGGSLVGWWKLDEGSGAYTEDSSGNSNHGYLVNSPAWTAGKKNKALDFTDGSNLVFIPRSSSLDQPGAMSACAWIYPESVVGGEGIILANGSSSTGYISQYSLEIESNQAACLFWSPDGAGFYYLCSPASVIAFNTWSHVCGVRSSSSAGTIYVNGAAQSTSVGGGSIPTSGFDDTFIAAAHFDGVIDDVRLYSSVLTASQVAGIYDASTKARMGGSSLGGGRVN